MTPAPSHSDDPVHAPHDPLVEYYPDEAARRGWVRGIFDRTAGDYDRIERLLGLGSGSWYRRQALMRAGLVPGMRVLDVATGTGLVAREAVTLLGPQRRIVGIDPSAGMLRGSGAPPVTVLQAAGERLPFADRAFDFVSMGFALRHLADLEVVFGEFRRVLAPGGRICVLEITRPEGRVPLSLLKIYMKGVVPLLSRLVARQSETPRLWRYYWDTIEACAPPAQVMATLVRCGFVDVERHVELGIFSEYRGRCPA